MTATVTPEELQDRVDHWTATYPEMVQSYWQLRSDPDQCNCCIQTVLSYEFGDVAWEPWFGGFEMALFLLGDI